jgi:3-oxoacyl-[acyl-carrier protein] reductase
MNSTKENKIAVVTGGSKGIGRAISIELAACGYIVAVNYKSDERSAAQTLEMIQKSGGRAELIPFDVSDPVDAERAVNAVSEELGRIDVLVNNAGIIADELFVFMPERSWDTVVSTTLKGFYSVTKPVLAKMLPNKRGAVVSISSVSALTGNRGQANYAAAKSGLIGASRAVATEVARLGIRVNVVAPGLIETEMIKDAPVQNLKSLIPMARIGRPEEVARVVRFLCSDDASYITGQVVSVNGGMI